jgi:hypothetical protein
MTLGHGIRRNIAHVDPLARATLGDVVFSAPELVIKDFGYNTYSKTGTHWRVESASPVGRQRYRRWVAAG